MGAIGEMGSAVRNRVRFQEIAASVSESMDSSGSESGSVRGEGFELNEDPSFWKDHNVQVVIRIRPISNAEISLQGNNKCVRQDSSQTVRWVGHPETRFTFDLVADEHVTQEQLFKVAGVPMVENCVGGYNSCMFAYGQTGSGKTHTMLGDIEGGTSRNSVNCGMTPRVFEYMFSRIQKEKEARRDEKLRFICKCSFLEIYNEHILDLLDPSSANLQIREDAKKGVHVENLREFEVLSARDVMQQLIQGSANRKVAATNMNRASSRSHSVFTCVIESKWEAQGVTHHRFARLNLVDLAGSERQKSSGAEGERLKEATNINKSLSTLGLVIMNLVSSNKKSQHVPYRDSKLTFLLQDSLGGNSKTTIIANISPSNCCSLETLSTLKFAQRAKFIRNNAIVNEDASGDVLVMRLQIQQLKKEVHHLQGLVNGGTENFRGDCLNAFTPGSPNTFKWEGVQGSFSPLTFDKRLSQRKEYEAALVAAFRRDQDKEAALKALTTGKQEAEQLATQRAEEVRSLKMRLRFREEAIKRLQAVNSGKLSAETHLLQEKEELLKEIEVLRNQVDRNPEVTRFAMENLQLKEELRRLQSFVEEGERDMLNEQITILQDKLLEALDWKLMHEKDAEVVQDRLSLTWGSSDNEENEFLHLQAIQNQREIDALRKNLTSCLEAKEKLERRVDELVSQLKELTSSSNAPNENSHYAGTTGPMHSEANDSHDDQMELKTMVEAIAAASQREAEAHETAIMLAKENQELREKIKVLFDDNNKLIELYEGVVASSASNQTDIALQIKHIEDSQENINHVNVDHLHQELNEMQEENDRLLGLYEKAMQEKDDLRNLERRFNAMHEENEKLLGLYDDAVQGKDEIKKLQCQLNELHEENDRLLGLYEKAMQEKDELKKQILLHEFDGNEHKDYIECEKQNKEHSSCVMSTEAKEEINCEEKLVQMDDEMVIGKQESEIIKDQVRAKLELVNDQLAATAKAIQSFKLLQKATFEVNELRDAVESKEQNVNLKQQEIDSLTYILPKSLERTTITENKLLALKVALQNFSSKVQYWDKREEQARQRVSSCTIPLEQKKEELRHLKIRKDEVDNACLKSRQAESELRNDMERLKLKLQNAETQKEETQRVLFAIDNKLDNSQRPTEFGKAFDMLKSEEERSKIFEEMKPQKQRLVTVRKEITDSTKISEALDAMIQSLEGGIKNGMCLLHEAEFKLQGIVAEKEVIFEMQETGRTTEMSKLLLEYQEGIFESELRKEEIKLCEESLQLEMSSLEELRLKYILAARKLTEWTYSLSLSKSNDRSLSVIEKLEIELRDIQSCLVDAKLL